jgi:hypothetical protein
MMVRLTHLSRFFIAATVLAAAMLLAPSGAQAHAGHHHGPVQVERSVSTPQIPSSVQTGYELRSEVSGAQSAVWIAAASFLKGKGTTSCAGGCCHSAGHGCCAAALPALITVGAPPTAVERLFAGSLWGPGITPGVLPEPPRYVV